MSLNRQPGPMNQDALRMLREKELKKGADVVTSDAQVLGKALSFHHRPEEDVAPDLKLYATYLEVPNLVAGSHFYVPVDFVTDFDPVSQRVNLSVPLSAVMDETWDREPSFVAGKQSQAEKLP